MNHLVEFLLGFLVLFLVFQDSEESQPYSWAGHVCSRGAYETAYTTYRTYRTRYQDYYTKCGWWNWGRCKKTRSWDSYYSASRSKSVHKTYYYCCSGWRQRGRYCSIPICRSGCVHGRCTAPNKCSCNRGWEGSRCQYDVNECSRSLHHCSQVCINTPGSFKCGCRKGYFLDGSRYCKDINECATNNGQCDHLCENTHGSYKCRCFIGYKLLSDGRRCLETDFPASFVPTPTVTYRNNSASSKLEMVCIFDFPTWNNVSYLVEWYANSASSPVKNDTWCNPEEGERTSNHSSCTRRQSVIRLPEHFAIGDTVWCKLYMRFSTSFANRWTITGKQSNKFDIGIEVSPRHVIIRECNYSEEGNVTVTLRPSIPIPALTGNGSVFVYVLLPEKLRTQVSVDKCSVELKTKDMAHGKTFSINGICDLQRREANRTFVFHFQVETSSPTQLFAAYRMPSFQVTLNNSQAGTGVCSSSPELLTFDGRGLTLDAVGDFILYRNDVKKMQVHIRLWICASRAFCVCGVAIREEKEVIVLSTCNNLLHQNTEAPMKIRVVQQSPRPSSRGIQIFRKTDGFFLPYYMILLKSGTRLKVHQRTEWLNVFVSTPGTDKRNVSGICGNFNDNSTDDFSQGGDGRPHTNAKEFVESWKLHNDKSLFNASNESEIEDEPEQAWKKKQKNGISRRTQVCQRREIWAGRSKT